MDFLKDKPGLQLMLNGLITFLGLLLMFWITTSTSSDKNVEQELIDIKLNKATHEYVDSQDAAIEKRMKENCEDIQVQIDGHTLYDKEQDARIETMRKEWREDHKEILKLIREIYE